MAYTVFKGLGLTFMFILLLHCDGMMALLACRSSDTISALIIRARNPWCELASRGSGRCVPAAWRRPRGWGEACSVCWRLEEVECPRISSTCPAPALLSASSWRSVWGRRYHWSSKHEMTGREALGSARYHYKRLLKVLLRERRWIQNLFMFDNRR